MAEITTKFVGIDRVLSDLKALQVKTDAAVNVATRSVAAEATRVAKMEIKGHHDAGTKTPSAIGTPPTNVSGNLRRSIKSDTVRVGFGTYKAIVGPTAVYGRAVELGAPNWPSGVAYPYMKPAADKLLREGRVYAIYLAALRKATSRI